MIQGIYIARLKCCMPYCNVANLVTITETNMMRRNASWLCNNHCSEYTAPNLPWSCAAVSAVPEGSGRAAHCSHLLSKSPADQGSAFRSSKIRLFYKSNLVAFGMHLHNCRCFPDHLRILLESVRALCLVRGGSGST